MVPVDRPLVEDTENEVAKDGLEEEHLGDEVGGDVREAFESQVVGDLQANSERHLRG